MPLDCDTCPQHAKGCEPQDYSELVGTLWSLSSSKLPGAKAVSSILATLANCVAFAEGCTVRAHQTVFPLMCTALGVMQVMATAMEQSEQPDAFESYLHELFGGTPDDRGS